MGALYLLIPLSPVIVNIICIVRKKGKLISLILTLCGVLFSLFFLMLNSGYGIGFGNPWIGVDWAYTAVFLVYLAVILVTHAKVPATGTLKTISRIFLILACIGIVIVVGSQITGTIEHLGRK